MARAKYDAYKDLYQSLAEGEEGVHRAIRIAKQKNKESQDVYQGRQSKVAMVQYSGASWDQNFRGGQDPKFSDKTFLKKILKNRNVRI